MFRSADAPAGTKKSVIPKNHALCVLPRRKQIVARFSPLVGVAGVIRQIITSRISILEYRMFKFITRSYFFRFVCVGKTKICHVFIPVCIACCFAIIIYSSAKEVTSIERQMVSMGSCSSPGESIFSIIYRIYPADKKGQQDCPNNRVNISDNGFHLFGLPWWVWLIVLSALFYTQR